MRNVKLVMEYEGTRYAGFKKGRKRTKGMFVEEKLEAVLTKLHQQEVSLTSAVNTEAGVHAYGQVCHYMCESGPSANEIKKYVNRYMPRDFRILEADETDERFHADFLKKSVQYIYRIQMGNSRDVFQRAYQHYETAPLDLFEMERAAKQLIGKKDFAAFCANKKMKKSTVRTIYQFELQQIEEELRMVFSMDDSFPDFSLYLVEALLEVGRGVLSAETLQTCFEKGQRGKLARKMAEAKGLALVQIEY